MPFKIPTIEIDGERYILIKLRRQSLKLVDEKDIIIRKGKKYIVGPKYKMPEDFRKTDKPKRDSSDYDELYLNSQNEEYLNRQKLCDTCEYQDWIDMYGQLTPICKKCINGTKDCTLRKLQRNKNSKCPIDKW